MLTWQEFETYATDFLFNEWNVLLKMADVQINGVSKNFDIVSDDEAYIGDVKFLKNIKVPAAKFSGISEYVWLLQQTNAKHKFMIFGRDIEIPERWLKKYSPLEKDVVFYFLKDDKLVKLN